MKQYIKDGIIKSRHNIVLHVTKEINGKEVKLQVFNPTEEAILADGWMEYIAPKIEPKKSRMQIVQELVVEQYNERTDISNEEALDYMAIIYPWDYYLDKVLTEGMMVTYDDKPWRVRQTHTPLEVYPPSLATASLYEAIDKEHDGTLEDPIPYNPPMEIFIDKYYIENNEIYKCIRNSDTALSHSLRDLIGIYVNKV
ncbi:MAG: hypothetical protein UF228_07970 [Lachnospiraceae bacterium]|nr:hypothetical protein [Lachnospiraceae bacterium]